MIEEFYQQISKASAAKVSKPTKLLVAVFYSASVCFAIVPCTKHVLGLYLDSRKTEAYSQAVVSLHWDSYFLRTCWA